MEFYIVSRFSNSEQWNNVVESQEKWFICDHSHGVLDKLKARNECSQYLNTWMQKLLPIVNYFGSIFFDTNEREFHTVATKYKPPGQVFFQMLLKKSSWRRRRHVSQCSVKLMTFWPTCLKNSLRESTLDWQRQSPTERYPKFNGNHFLSTRDISVDHKICISQIHILSLSNYMEDWRHSRAKLVTVTLYYKTRNCHFLHRKIINLLVSRRSTIMSCYGIDSTGQIEFVVFL